MPACNRCAGGHRFVFTERTMVRGKTSAGDAMPGPTRGPFRVPEQVAPGNEMIYNENKGAVSNHLISARMKIRNTGVVNILPGAAFSAAVFCACLISAGCAEREPSGKPHIILFSLDTLRADHLSGYGYARRTSPHIDEFAQDSVLFYNAISQSPLTAPGHMSIFTALTPAVHLVNNPNDKNPDLYNRLSDDIPTLAELLGRGGYLTVGMTGGGTVSPDFGFDRGFDSYSDDFFFNFQTVYYTPERELQTIRRHIQESEKKGKPLFLFLHHYLCHDPYIHAPREINTRFLTNPVKDLPLSRSDLLKSTEAGWGIYDESSFWRNVDLSKPDHRAQIVALYDGNIFYADDIFGQIVEILKQENLYDNSMIILTSDHGEEFYEHGGKLHGRLFVEHLHVPLIVKFPRNQYAGTRIKETVRTLDLLPTLCQYLDMPVTHPIQGFSLLPLLTQQGTYAPVIASYALDYQGPDTKEMEVRIRLVNNGYAYSNREWQGQKEWLFNTTEDRAEQRNLAGSDPERLGKMRAEAGDILKNSQLLRNNFTGGEGAAAPLSDTLKKQLKALGYIQ